MMKTFDELEIRRPALAQSYLHLLEAQPGRPIALFAPRRVGETFFLDHDLMPAAAADPDVLDAQGLHQLRLVQVPSIDDDGLL